MAIVKQIFGHIFSARTTTIGDPQATPSFFDRKFKTIKGDDLNMEELKGKVILLVNTASECGYTPQLKTLQELQEKYQSRGLVVLGVPCNNFGKQEPGDEAKVCSLYEGKFKTAFLLTNKQDKDVPTEVFQWIIDVGGKDLLPKWNFHKYLINREGHLVQSWKSNVTPLDKEITDAIERLL